MNKKERLVKILLEDDDLLLDVVKELNTWDGCLDWLDFWNNDNDFFEVFFQNKEDVARAVSYGDYHYMDDFVRFNIYGNLESMSYDNLIDELKSYIDDIVTNLIDKYDGININIDNYDIKKIMEENEENEVDKDGKNS